MGKEKKISFLLIGNFLKSLPSEYLISKVALRDNHFWLKKVLYMSDFRLVIKFFKKEGVEYDNRID